jgi:hypothetical protein
MCSGAEIPLLIAALGTAVKVVNDNQALRRADAELARGIIAQGKLDKEGDARIREELASLEQSGPEQDRQEALGAFRTALRENQDLAQGAVAGVPGASERFAENVEAGKATISGKASTRAGLIARIDAPIRQRQREGLNVGRLGTDLGDIGQRSQSADFLAKLRASQRGVPDPFVDALGQFAQSFGTGLATSGATFGGNELGKAASAGTIIDPSAFPQGGQTVFNA